MAVGPGRTLKLPSWIQVHRTRGFEQRADLTRRPPAMTIEHALIDANAARMAAGDVPGAFALLAETVHSRRTTPDRILTALDTRQRVAHRATLEGLVTDLRDGACSVLERGYMYRVERRHGLPRGDRQHESRASGRRTAQDVQYGEYGVIVELDGRAYHASAQARDRDARRDLAELAVNDIVTVRVTYGLVFHEACRTAARIATILQDPMASLNPLFTIFRQVAEPAFFHQRLRGRPLRERVQHLLRAVRIPSPEWRMRDCFSGKRIPKRRPVQQLPTSVIRRNGGRLKRKAVFRPRMQSSEKCDRPRLLAMNARVPEPASSTERFPWPTIYPDIRRWTRLPGRRVLATATNIGHPHLRPESCGRTAPAALPPLVKPRPEQPKYEVRETSEELYATRSPAKADGLRAGARKLKFPVCPAVIQLPRQ